LYLSYLIAKYFERQDYWSVGAGRPSKDASRDYKLIKASEEGGKTYVDFYRNATTGDAKDVQFTVKGKFYMEQTPDIRNSNITKSLL